MGVKETLCMKGGSGETSYANNSALQRSVIGGMRPMLEESIRAIFSTTSPECLTIADLGCSTGPNTLAVLQSIIDIAVSTCQSAGLKIPEFNVLMNDLPQNDFNTVFKSLSSFYKKIEEEKGAGISCFISGTPGSFHGRLFPSKSVHFINSSSCLHFLSQAPKGLMGRDGKEILNRGGIYVHKDSPPEFLKAYQEQFGKDLTMFLRCRSEEIVDRGRILISLVCTHDDEPLTLSDLINRALYKLASEGQIDKEKLDAFNLPMYAPTIQRVKQVIEAEGSFILHRHDASTIDASAAIRSSTTVDIDYSKAAKSIGNMVRAAAEPMLVSELGEEVMDALFRLIEDMLMDELATGKDFRFLNLALSLIKRV